jgi:hypothetical protein
MPASEKTQLAALYEILDIICREDGFEHDDDGSINVHVVIQPQTFAEFPASYMEIPEAKEYIAANPKFRDGYDLCYAYPFSVRNIASSVARVASFQWRAWQLPSWLPCRTQIAKVVGKTA